MTPSTRQTVRQAIKRAAANPEGLYFAECDALTHSVPEPEELAEALSLFYELAERRKSARIFFDMIAAGYLWD